MASQGSASAVEGPTAASALRRTATHAPGPEHPELPHLLVQVIGEFGIVEVRISGIGEKVGAQREIPVDGHPGASIEHLDQVLGRILHRTVFRSDDRPVHRVQPGDAVPYVDHPQRAAQEREAEPSAETGSEVVFPESFLGRKVLEVGAVEVDRPQDLRRRVDGRR